MALPPDSSSTLARPGGWRCGDPAGRRRFQRLFDQAPLRLASGDALGPITIAWECWGQLAADGSNAVLLLHGFSGDSHAAGPAEPGHPTPGWWDGLIGPGLAIDTDRFFVVCPNVLGGCQGSTGPGSLAADGRPWGRRFPVLTIRDQVAAEQAFARALGVERWHAVIGGSMGGMRALEWAIERPDAVQRLVLLATTARCSPENIAFHAAQIRAIELDPLFRDGDWYDSPAGGPWRGLALARSIARLTYGCERELLQRFHPDDEQAAATGAVERFLQADGDALCRRFDPNSYITLTRAMSLHDVGRGRGGVAAALGRIQARTRVVSVSSDRLFPPHCQRQLAEAIHSGVTFSSLESQRGHDGFLEEHRQLEPILRQSLG